MSLKGKVLNSALMAAYKRGFEIRRHPAARRHKLITARGVDLVLDVGGADGGFGRALRQFGYAGRIVSFEPLAHSYAELSEAIAGDPRWTARNHALGDVAGEAQINVASNSTSSSLLPMQDSHREAEPNVDIVRTETIRVERLDDVAPEFLGTDDTVYLKVDTQGFERQVLAGGPDVLARSVGLQLELSFVSLYEGGMLANEAISLAYDAGFHLEVIEQGWASATGQMLQADGIFFRS
ncbi:FkbM family methyltransferase [Marmoricola sp. OAE513]|uniref:FkbM family methyltransferase n=1 Tax=Marmoricola sp. OAE513 TaxID=2817894 RepID=UPI001AE71E37